MIKSNELRLGNYVYADTGLPSLEICSLSEGDMIDLFSGKLTDKISAIDVSEEWILKLGFSKWKNKIFKKTWGKGGIEFIELFPDGLFCLETGRGSVKAVYFVHELQNLYFALTGEELTIKKDSNEN